MDTDELFLVSEWRKGFKRSTDYLYLLLGSFQFLVPSTAMFKKIADSSLITSQVTGHQCYSLIHKDSQEKSRQILSLSATNCKYNFPRKYIFVFESLGTYSLPFYYFVGNKKSNIQYFTKLDLASILCSMFPKQTCSRFTRLVVTMPKIPYKTL